VDYAHTDDALQKVLENLSEIKQGKIITVFGCGGDRDRGKRPLMGKTATAFSDLAVLTSDNPRTEDPLEIIREIEAGIHRASIRRYLSDRGQRT
jgi:UDP-N-acetylmuramoyl-L-alanyl-D-glutamate--2,6-diaminopimelate ligase